jgi:hypothetical protein
MKNTNLKFKLKKQHKVSKHIKNEDKKKKKNIEFEVAT